MTNIGFIGAGNMASSMIGGLLRADYDRTRLRAADPAAAEKTSALGIEVTAYNNDLAAWADIIILAVKPQVLRHVCRDIAPLVQQRQPLILSVAAGIRSETIGQWLDCTAPIIRIMPNTPALIGLGMSGLFANPVCRHEHKTRAEHIMQTVGKTVWLDNESDIDTVTAISGSGPAYFFLFIEGLVAAAQQQGLDHKVAQQLALQTALGAASMAAQSDVDPAELRRRVTSPGGTTERAIETFLAADMPQLIAQAVDAAKRRSAELSIELGNPS